MANPDKQFRVFLGKNLRAYREKKSLSQEQLGKLAGVHRTYVGMVERGEKNITLQNMLRFAGALKIQVRDLITF